jgi:hypothetical protein
MIIFITFLFALKFLISIEADTKISFWDNQPRRGANCMNEVPTEQWFKEAASIHIEWVRLAYDKWDTDQRDFLLGDVSDYKGLVKKDLKKLKEVLSWAEKYELKVVIVPLSLPGCRWRQNNDNQPDLRLWEDFAYQQKALQFWIDLASELKDYSCIVAYDILNEPCPELLTGIEEQTIPGEADRFSGWYSKYKDTPRDLYLFYQRVINAVREIDQETPIMVESGFYAQPSAYLEWPDKLEDSKVLYSFHIYEPYAFTSGNNFRDGGKYEYPGKVLFGSDEIWWDKSVTELYLNPFMEWLNKHSVPVNRVVAAEFGCMRRNKGVDRYLEDILTLLEDRSYHWAFYSFREDGWDGYDYELGTQGPGLEYWQSIDHGEKPPLLRKDNALFDIIKKRLEIKNEH